jgi:hypothetical protein
VRLSELTLRVSPHQLVGLERFTGLEVTSRDLVPEAGPSWLLTGFTPTGDRHVLAFLLDDAAGESALYAVTTSLAAGQYAVDLVRYTRKPSDGETQALLREESDEQEEEPEEEEDSEEEGEDAQVEGAGSAEGV